MVLITHRLVFESSLCKCQHELFCTRAVALIRPCHLESCFGSRIENCTSINMGIISFAWSVQLVYIFMCGFSNFNPISTNLLNSNTSSSPIQSHIVYHRYQPHCFPQDVRGWVLTTGTLKNFIDTVKTCAKLLIKPDLKLCTKEIREISHMVNKYDAEAEFCNSVLCILGGRTDLPADESSRSQKVQFWKAWLFNIVVCTWVCSFKFDFRHHWLAWYASCYLSWQHRRWRTCDRTFSGCGRTCANRSRSYVSRGLASIARASVSCHT